MYTENIHVILVESNTELVILFKKNKNNVIVVRLGKMADRCVYVTVIT